MTDAEVGKVRNWISGERLRGRICRSAVIHAERTWRA
jgi:hypothetical protein